jgi:hypothetical protein
MYIYCIYSTHILYRSVSPLVVWFYTIKDEAVSPLISRKYSVSSGNFVFKLHGMFQDRNPGIKQDLPVFCLHYAYSLTFSCWLFDCWSYGAVHCMSALVRPDCRLLSYHCVLLLFKRYLFWLLTSLLKGQLVLLRVILLSFWYNCVLCMACSEVLVIHEHKEACLPPLSIPPAPSCWCCGWNGGGI